MGFKGLRSHLGCGTLTRFKQDQLLGMQMKYRLLVLILTASAIAPSISKAAGTHFHAPRSAAPVFRSAPVFHPSLPRQLARPRTFTPAIHAVGRPRNHIFANPIRRAPERFVSFRGGRLGLPPLTGLVAPVVLDIPELGEVIVPQETYVVLYPLLISERESDGDLAYTLLKQQKERNPESLVRETSQPASRVVAGDPCPNCKDTIEILQTCRPIGDCDLAERLVNSPRNPAYLVPERTAYQSGSAH